MRLLILSFYFRPDLSAGAFRTNALVDELLKILPADSEIDVLTTRPNRYHSFAPEAPLFEHQAGLRIYRIPLPEHRSGMMDQGRGFVHYARGVWKMLSGRRYDVVFATSGRLMTAVLGTLVARKMKGRLYLDIRDIFVESIRDVMPSAVSLVTTPIFSALERWALERADRVNLVSPGFAPYFERRYPHRRFSYLTNGIDSDFLVAASGAVTKSPERSKPLTITYAGNVGDGQALHEIVPDLAERLGKTVIFKVIGDGGRLIALQTELEERGITNVVLHPPVQREELINIYLSSDVLFLHLNAYNAFERVLPSKIFEYAAMGKPIWAGVAGYAAEFLRSEVPNSVVFRPCDVDHALDVFDTLELRTSARPDFVAKYSRSAVSRALAEDLLSIAGGSF